MIIQRLFNHRTVTNAYDSPDGQRLEQIMKEHIKLAKSLILSPGGYSAGEKDLLKERIEELRTEREAILSKYEEVVTK
ncbi:hypothetical protein [Cohnella silvisoli]|uniref:Uncharacterized protein n=1 Tax=Cohnella silvisoli TaxID=2873699 RepID=A0ABV1L316_9BACL|nr:hypothetical protein [Cohnella silvisoli]MCD9026018.1 hypothetical protein [Cohnella silvisoli]